MYIEGYFQSEKYYKWSLQSLLKEFSFKKNIMNQKVETIKKLKESNSVSIHLRQNKFLKDEKHRNLNTLNLEFINNNVSLIKKGIKYFDNKLDNPQYFLWSNNFSDVKSLLPTNRITFMDENLNKDPAYDLYLMSLCKHFILSPSTMHYWAALLSKNKEKICIGPTKIKNTSGYYGFSNNEDIKPDWWQEI